MKTPKGINAEILGLALLFLLRFEEYLALCPWCVVLSVSSLSVSQVSVLIAVAHLQGYFDYVYGTTTNAHDGSVRGLDRLRAELL